MRAIAIMPPGMFLSQPPITSTPSIAWPLTLVSIASAITSRDTSEYFIASVPMPMPSVTVGTPNTCGFAPLASSAAIARSMSGWMPALQGFIVEWPLATPTIGLSKSPSPKLTARSIARLGERATPWVMSRERRLTGSAMESLLREAECTAGLDANPIQLWARVIPIGYGYPGYAPAALHRRRGRAAALRPRCGGAPHLAAAAVARDPRPRGPARREAAGALAAQGRVDGRGRALLRRSEAPARPARARGPRSRRDGCRRERAAAPGLRLARRLRRAAGPAQGIQGVPARRVARPARDAVARAGRRAVGRRARFRIAPAARGGRFRAPDRAERALRGSVARAPRRGPHARTPRHA